MSVAMLSEVSECLNEVYNNPPGTEPTNLPSVYQLGQPVSHQGAGFVEVVDGLYQLETIQCSESYVPSVCERG